MTTPNHTRLENVRGVGPKRFNAILAKLAENQQSLDDLFRMPAAEIKEKFKLPKNVAEGIANVPELPTTQPEGISLLASKGIQILKSDTDPYPERLKIVLGDHAPLTVYVWGNLDLLKKPAVGFCGSRNVTEKGLDVAADTAQQIAELGWIVVSGHARGVDTMAHRIALEKGGCTIIVAAEGILSFKLRQELKKIAKPEQILIISEFAPEAGWTVGNAMTRNKTIVGLSDAMILVEARSEGGTFEAGKTALRYKIPLYVVQYETPGENAAGNEYFLKRGANYLRKNSDTGKAELNHLRETVSQKQKQDPTNKDAESKQLTLAGFKENVATTLPTV